MRKTLLALCLLASLRAEEGMWPFNMLPYEQITEKYGVTLDKAWAEHIQRSCVRISLGGSGSFVSKNGLVLTNHHVGSAAIYNLSTADKDLMTNGFYAATLEQELKCPNAYVDQLVSIEDVTKRVTDRLTKEMTTAQQEEARKLVIAEIEKEAEANTHLQPQVVTLYQGARYHLYLYKRYSDVRLVMAPEKSIAFFGGDKDNFEYPRYDLDMCFFRVYDNGAALQVDDHLQWSLTGPQLDEVLFVAGNPGSTNRMLTSPHLEFLKDLPLPLYLKWFKAKKSALEIFAKESAENARIAQQSLFGLDNSIKVMTGMYKGLAKGSIIENKKAYEKTLYGDPEKFAPWVKLKDALHHAKTYFPAYLILEGRGSNYSKLYMWAKDLVRVAVEKDKPLDTRLPEYADTEIPTLELNLFSTEPVYLGLERVNLIVSLHRLIEVLGKDNPAVKIALAGKTPEERADELLKTTRLQDLAYRKELYSSPEAIKKSTDPMILMALALDPFAREVRKQEEDEFESVENESYAAIAGLVFEKYGETVYPDATFTLRLSMGTMKEYQQKDEPIKPMTTVGGAYAISEKHDNKEPYQLPRSWEMKGDTLQNTPFNFVSTNDSVGGNSGSPIINSKGELVGLLFDGNIYTLTWSYEFDEVQGRSVGVHSVGMIETLEKIYDAKALAEELKGTSSSP
jgi:hypothetical protein